MSSSGSKTAVYTAITANSVVMLAKFAGFFLTGSGAMLAEGIHSLADVGNQALLAVGMRQAEKPADEQHPFGYGREAFVWTLISAVGIFFLGCGVTIAHGVNSLFAEHHEVEAKGVAIGILLFSLLVEGGSMLVAVRALVTEARANGQSLGAYIRSTDDPFGVAVLLEDGAAVLGVLLALAALVLSHFTHQEFWDPLGSIAVGTLLGALALYLITKSRTLLVGRAVGAKEKAQIEQILSDDPAIEHVAVHRAAVEGTASYRISAEIDLDGRFIAEKWLEGKDLVALATELGNAEALRAFLGGYAEDVVKQAGAEIDRIEAELERQVPKAKDIALEPD